MTDFDLSAVDAQDEGELVIKHPKTLEPTGWIWTFYGPGHPVTIELANCVAGAEKKPRPGARRKRTERSGKSTREARTDPRRERRQHCAADEGFHADQARWPDDRVQRRFRKAVAVRAAGDAGAITFEGRLARLRTIVERCALTGLEPGFA